MSLVGAALILTISVFAVPAAGRSEELFVWPHGCAYHLLPVKGVTERRVSLGAKNIVVYKDPLQNEDTTPIGDVRKVGVGNNIFGTQPKRRDICAPSGREADCLFAKNHVRTRGQNNRCLPPEG